MDDIATRLKRRLTPDIVVHGSDAHAWAFDGLEPEAVVRARSADDVAVVLGEAQHDGTAVYPHGGGTAMGCGGLPARRGVVLDTRGLDRVIDHAARDMTITVQAGMTVAALQARLGTERQRLAVDPPLPEQATVGGLIATGASGPLRFAHGTVRDHLLGVRVVDAAGDVVCSGGRVVKNVAGYNLCRLYAGSFGTLGVVVEATFQVRPVPAAHACLWAGLASADQAERALASLVESQTGPAYVELLGQRALDLLDAGARPRRADAPWWIAVGLQGHPDAVRSSRDALRHALGALDPVSVQTHEPDQADTTHRALADWPACAQAHVVWRAGVISSRVVSFCEQARAASRQHGLDLALSGHAGNGVVYGAILGQPRLEGVQGMLDGLLKAAAPAHGNVVVLRSPTEWKPSLPVWGAPRGDRHAMRRLKQALDPRSILNPGRFADGL